VFPVALADVTKLYDAFRRRVQFLGLSRPP
jgi:hypothetical protein